MLSVFSRRRYFLLHAIGSMTVGLNVPEKAVKKIHSKKAILNTEVE